VTDWRRSLRRVFADAGADGNPHMFSHSFATDLLTRGLAVEDAAILLGHSSPSSSLSTMRISSRRGGTDSQRGCGCCGVLEGRTPNDSDAVRRAQIPMGFETVANVFEDAVGRGLSDSAVKKQKASEWAANDDRVDNLHSLLHGPVEERPPEPFQAALDLRDFRHKAPSEVEVACAHRIDRCASDLLTVVLKIRAAVVTRALVNPPGPRLPGTSEDLCSV
jgi:hypothetical protein